MANLTLITDAETGEIIGAAHGHVGHPPGTEGVSAGLLAGPGQKLEHVDIPDDLSKVKDAAEFSAQLKAHLGR